METKKCKTCQCEKPITEFYSNGFTPAGTKKYKAHCGPCYNKRTKQKKQDTIREILKELEIDIECSVCGYNKNWAALTFHHLDPNEKDFSISDCGMFSKDRLRQEIEKCVLLCHNCHMEEHYPHLEIVADDN